MSVSITYPTPQNTTILKQFLWDVKDNRTVGRGIGGYYNVDQPATPYSTTSTTEVTIKSYTFTSSANTNYIRVRIWGYVTGANGAEAKLYINNTLESSLQVPNTSNGLLIDYIGSIPSSSSITVNVNGYIITSGVTLYITQVTIIAGFGLTSTTAVNILTITLGTNDTYTLNVTGNFVYTVGIRWWAKGNRKTTAAATISSNLVNEIQGYYQPTANNDTDNNVFLQLRTGNYATSFTISGNVGASGDVIIITEIYCQIILRGNNPDSFGVSSGWTIIIKEKGIMSVTSHQVTIDGSAQTVGYWVASSNLQHDFNYLSFPYQSSSSLDFWTTNLILPTNDSPEVMWHCNGNTESASNTVQFFLYVNIIIMGV